MKAWVGFSVVVWLAASGCSSSSQVHNVECSPGEITQCVGIDGCRGEQTCRGNTRRWGDCICTRNTTSAGGGSNVGGSSSEGGSGGGDTTSTGGNPGSGASAGMGGTTESGGTGGGSGGDASTGGAGNASGGNAGDGSGGDGSGGNAGSGGTGSGGTGGTDEVTCPTDLDGPALVPIPGGRTDIGQLTSVSGLYDTEPVTSVRVAGFCLDQTEVTVQDYAGCQLAPGEPCTVPEVSKPDGSPFPDTYFVCDYDGGSMPDTAQLPVNCVSWAQASAYCEYVGKRLPTEFEWEYAARGKAARAYPWGDEDPPVPDNGVMNTLANWHTDGPVLVGAYPDGATPEGVLDMTGNLWEWVEDEYCTGYDTGNRTCLSTHVARGGGWSTELIQYLRAWARDSDADGDARYGFRCALTP